MKAMEAMKQMKKLAVRKVSWDEPEEWLPTTAFAMKKMKQVKGTTTVNAIRNMTVMKTLQWRQ